MDQFGVLVESMGFKSQRSAPMAHLKSKPKTNFSFPQERENPSRSPLYGDSFVDDLDGIFQAKNNGNSEKSHNYFDDGNYLFGGSFVNSNPQAATQQGSIDLELVFDFKKNSKESSNLYDDLLTSGPRQSNDLFGDFRMNSESSKEDNQETESQFDDLIPGFGGIGPSSNESENHGLESETKFSQPSMANDPFSVFESPTADASSWPFSDPVEQNAGKGSVESSIDELEKFAMGKVPDANDKPYGETLGNIKIPLENKNGKTSTRKDTQAEILREKQREKDKGRVVKDKVTKEKKEAVLNEGNLDDIFGMGAHSGNVNRPSSQTEDPDFDTLFNEKRVPEVKKPSSRPSYKKEKSPSVAIFSNNFSSLFGEATSSSEEFQEIEGESEERRRARMNQHMRTQARMEKALDEKNQRDLKTQHEQEERRRLADSLDYNIKRWSAGKEDNLRALLSSLQDVLWPECGWQTVSLTDLITSTSVKKVYYKATLCVHPDKVQQRGSNLQQKYIAEKVFDLLKEAWNKFSAAELR
ncbi:hypothetical protein ACH5RR_034096 [Cinchona calisaya]|uniref:Uncharacterized protein n=1 Tax=Cinchona calisaya TaxID=153742 RepID=A0ABD2YDH5_9GENT